MDKQSKIEMEGDKLQKNQLIKQLVFKEYPSIQPSIRDKTIKAIRDHGFNNENIQWIATQKIHGSNFSIHCSGEKVRYGRRTDFITQDINMKCQDACQHFKQSFFDAKNLVNKYHNNLENVYKDLKQIYPDMVKFVIYGQYFGGYYPGIVEKRYKHVQKGIYYIPHHEFMAFDIRVYTDKIAFWVDVSDIPKILKDNIKSIPIYARGTFDQMLNLDSKIDSTIPELLGFGKVEKNIIEGFVIRPNHNLKFKNNERVILKKKNQQFLEIVNGPNAKKDKKNNKQQKKQDKKQKQIDPQTIPYIETLQKYLNFNRIESVVSKFPDMTDRARLKSEIIKDIMGDAVKDQFKLPQGELKKKVKAQFDKKAMKMVNEYYQKIEE